MATTNDGKSGGNICFSCYNTLKSQNFSEASTLLRLINLLNAGLVIFAGIYEALDLKQILTLHLAYLAISIYLLLFGCLLCCFECRIGFIEENFRKYFGFMFTYVGRTTFLLFIGLFCLGLQNKNAVGFVIGGFTFFNALLNCFVMYHHNEMYADPTKKYATAESAAQRYVENNPELASAAVGSAANFAVNNPQFTRPFATATMDYARNNPGQAKKAVNTLSMA